MTVCKLGDVERMYDARLCQCEVLVLLYTRKMADLDLPEVETVGHWWDAKATALLAEIIIVTRPP